jgi:hypothetical protein
MTMKTSGKVKKVGRINTVYVNIGHMNFWYGHFVLTIFKIPYSTKW